MTAEDNFLNQAATGQVHDILGDDYPWFVPRMVTDEWTFGLLVSGDLVLVITRIDAIREYRGTVWLDVNLATEVHSSVKLPESLRLMYAPLSGRTTASVRADSVIAAFELSTG